MKILTIKGELKIEQFEVEKLVRTAITEELDRQGIRWETIELEKATTQKEIVTPSKNEVISVDDGFVCKFQCTTKSFRIEEHSASDSEEPANPIPPAAQIGENLPF